MSIVQALKGLFCFDYLVMISKLSLDYTRSLVYKRISLSEDESHSYTVVSRSLSSVKSADPP